jgi:ferrochelatase
MVGRPGLGVILLQLGTPAAPTSAALRPYLRQFLWDRRVIDWPRALWWPILHGVVLRTRPKKSARLYQKVWTPNGSPLAVTTAAQAAALEARLAAEHGPGVRVVVGMRYGEPSIASALAQVATAGIDHLLAFPMYPQYASATTGTSLEHLFQAIGGLRIVPAIRVVPPYYEDPAYINALVAVARTSLASMPTPADRLLLSFHGLPRRYVDEGDPYAAHCKTTGARLAAALDWPAAPMTVTFQSRFGREEWLQPYTDKTLEAWGRAGARVAVMCPGFTADCLETLEEIALRGAEQFRHVGGRTFHVIPCLNDHPAWIDAMATIATRELAGWL